VKYSTPQCNALDVTNDSLDQIAKSKCAG